MTGAPYSIGSDLWPGLSKLIEECGEATVEVLADWALARAIGRVGQVSGKLMGTGGEVAHWDGGPPLNVRVEDEIADLEAAAVFFRDVNKDRLDITRMRLRTAEKLRRFRQWHAENQGHPSGSPAFPNCSIPEACRCFGQGTVACLYLDARTRLLSEAPGE